MGMMETTIEIPVQHEQNVFGQFDAHAKKIEQTLKSWERLFVLKRLKKFLHS